MQFKMSFLDLKLEVDENDNIFFGKHRIGKIWINSIGNYNWMIFNTLSQEIHVSDSHENAKQAIEESLTNWLDQSSLPALIEIIYKNISEISEELRMCKNVRDDHWRNTQRLAAECVKRDKIIEELQSKLNQYERNTESTSFKPEKRRVITSSVIRDEKCDHKWSYTGTDYHGSHKGEDHYECNSCGSWKYELE